MSNFLVTFKDVIEADTEEDAWAKFLTILASDVEHGCVSAFDFTNLDELEQGENK